MLKRIFFCAAFLLSSLFSFSQSKKEIRVNKIKSTTEFTTETIAGKEVTYKSQYITFDKNGNTTEKTDYNAAGTVTKKETAKFDGKGNKTEETHYVLHDTPDTKTKNDSVPKTGVKNTHIVSKFNSNNNKVEEIVYDAASNKQIKKTQTSYNSNGDKTIEVHFDADNKLVKKEVFNYDNKGLKIEHKIYDGANTLIEGKKFVYQF